MEKNTEKGFLFPAFSLGEMSRFLIVDWTFLRFLPISYIFIMICPSWNV